MKTWRAKITHATPRWFTVIASKSVHSDTMQFEANISVDVLAVDANDAMRKVRAEFRFHHLRVQP